MPKLNRKKFFILACFSPLSKLTLPFLPKSIRLGIILLVLIGGWEIFKPNQSAKAQFTDPFDSFEVGFYDAYAENYATIKNDFEGFNTVEVWSGRWSRGTPSNQLSAIYCNTLQQAAALDLKVQVELLHDARHESENFWRGFIEDVAACDGSQTIRAWFLEALEETDNTARIQEYVHQYDPYQRPFRAHIEKHAPDYLNYLKMSDGEFKKFCFVDQFYEGLYFKYGGLPIVANRAWDEKILRNCPNSELIAHPQFFSGINGSFEGPCGSNCPTPEEFRAETYTHLIAGASGLSPYSYRYAGSNPPLMNAYDQIGQELNGPTNLAGVLLNGQNQIVNLSIQSGPANAPQIYSGGPAYPSIFYTAKSYNGSTYLLAVNHATKTVTAQFSDLPQTSGQAEVLFENRNLTIQNSTLADTFATNEVHIYRMEGADGPSPTPTPSPSPSPSSSCLADINNDNTVNLADIVQILQAWGSCPGCAEDVDGNGFVNVADIISVLQAWGKCG